MSTFTVIDRQDPRHETLKKGFNLRWPTYGHGADFIYICDSADAVLSAANDALAKGMRITVRSGGHCYEGLVADKLNQDKDQQLAIIDLGQMTGLEFSEDAEVKSPYDPDARYKFRAATGNQNWDGYVGLYKAANRTIPGGSCYSVGSGGHVSGGGYGLLSRMHGLTVDWLSGVDILIPSVDGKSLIPRHVNLDSQGLDWNLFVACRGAGGGNFGIILNYYYKELPTAPQKAWMLSLAWPWETFKSKSDLERFLNAYWLWFKNNDADWNSKDMSKANGGLFTLLKLQHRSTGDINLLIQYTGMNGRVDGHNQTEPLKHFVQYMNEAARSNAKVTPHDMAYGPIAKSIGARKELDDPLKDGRLMDWLYLTQTINGSGSNQFAKYKSFYQIGYFGKTEIDAIWKYFNQDNPILNQALLQIDSYGGCINTNNEKTNPTSVYQRNSLLKSQLQVYWTDHTHEETCLQWSRDFYKEYFSAQGGKPFAENNCYEGCYINYPDIDMKYTGNDHKTVDSRWLELYYGPKRNMLISTKQALDPENIFRSELSVPLSHP